MNINSNALTVIGSPNSTRKMDEITASPIRQPQTSAVVNNNEAEWRLPSESSRTQGSTKHRKTNAGMEDTPKQSKLSSFFARVNAASSPNPPNLTSLSRASLLQTQTQVGMTTPTKRTDPPSLNSPRRAQPTAIPILKQVPVGASAQTIASLPAGTTLLNPNTNLHTSEAPRKIQDTTEEEEYEPPLSALKVRPKRKPATPKTGEPTLAMKGGKVMKKTAFSTDAPGVRMVIPDDPAPPPKPAKINHPFRTVLQTTVRVEKTKDVLKDFTGKLLDALAFLRVHVDSTAAILPKDKDFMDAHIVDTASFPTVVFALNQRYFQFESRAAFTSAAKTVNGRSIKLSLVLGTSINLDHQLLDELRHDISTLGVTFWYKPHQEVDTCTRLVFLGAPNNANKEEVKDIIENALKPLEKHLVETDPKAYPPDTFGLPWPKFAVTSEQPTGMPYEPPSKGKERVYVPPPMERRALHIMCHKKDYTRLATLIMIAKAKKMWLKELGMCYPTEAPDHTFSKTDVNKYVKMVDVHESAQMSYGTNTILGLSDPGVQSLLRREIGDPISISVRQIMRMITMPRQIINGKVVPGKPVWLGVLLTDNGKYTGYYAGANKKYQQFAADFAKCPAAQIYFFLVRHGVMQRDVDKFIRNNFNLQQVRLISQATYSGRTALAKIPIQPGEENIVDAARLDDSLVDLTKMTKRDFEEEEAADGTYTGPSAKDPACYHFDEAQSVTTVKNRSGKYKDTAAGKSVTSISLGESRFEVGEQQSDEEEEATRRTSDPLEALQKETMHFDLGYLATEARHSNLEHESTAETDTTGEEGAEASGTTKVSPNKKGDIANEEREATIATQMRDLEDSAELEASLMAAAVGLDLNASATAGEEDRDREGRSFATILTGNDRSFTDMYDILASLILEEHTRDPTECRTVRASHAHIPDGLREYLTAESNESGESALEYIIRLRKWLMEAEIEIAMEENSTAIEETRHEVQYDANGNVLPRPEEYGEEEPQGCGTRDTQEVAAASATTLSSSTGTPTSQLGADKL